MCMSTSISPVPAALCCSCLVNTLWIRQQINKQAECFLRQYALARKPCPQCPNHTSMHAHTHPCMHADAHIHCVRTHRHAVTETRGADVQLVQEQRRPDFSAIVACSIGIHRFQITGGSSSHSRAEPPPQDLVSIWNG